MIFPMTSIPPAEKTPPCHLRADRLLGRLALVNETGRQLGGAGVHGGTELLHLQGEVEYENGHRNSGFSHEK